MLKPAFLSLLIFVSAPTLAQYEGVTHCRIIKKAAIDSFRAKSDPTIKPESIENRGFNRNAKTVALWFIKFAQNDAKSEEEVANIVTRKCLPAVIEANYYDSVARIWTEDRMDKFNY